MQFELEKALEILERTPHVLRQLLHGLSEEWYHATEGPDTFSPYDVLGHLVHGEKTDWMPRLNKVLAQSTEPFEPYDRFAQYEESHGKTLDDLLEEFTTLRTANVTRLRSLNIRPEHHGLQGVHPAFGPVTLSMLLATWTAHDLGHIAQVARVMAKQYKDEVGPWLAYLPVLTRQ